MTADTLRCFTQTATTTHGGSFAQTQTKLARTFAITLALTCSSEAFAQAPSPGAAEPSPQVPSVESEEPQPTAEQATEPKPAQASSGAGNAAPPPAPSNDELLKRVSALEEQLAQLQARPAPTPAPIAPPTPAAATQPAAHETVDLAAGRDDPLARLEDKTFPGSTALFGSDVRFKFGGYIKLDLLYDVNGNPDQIGFSVSGIETDDPAQNDRAGYFAMQARESRFNFEVRHMGLPGPSNEAFFEIDFCTASLTSFIAPRLRHAFFRWGPVLLGQTWSLLTDMRSLPFIIDFAYSDSINAARVPQVRWQQEVLPWLVLRAGVEMPETGDIDNQAELPGQSSPQLPRVAGGGSLQGKRAFFSAGASLQQLRWDFEDSQDNSTKFAWNAVANARIFLDSIQTTFIGLHGQVGRGSAESLGVFAKEQSNATLGADGKLHPLFAYNLVVSYAHRWLPPLSTNFSFAWDRLRPVTSQSSTAMIKSWSLHANVIWQVAPPFKTGVEYMVAGRVNVDESRGFGQRIQAMGMYTF